jgi:predicted permease
MLDALIYDLRYALRTLRRSPGFTLVAVLTLALGIGANAALFTIADRLLLRPPAGVRDPDSVARLYTVERSSIGGEQTDWGTGYPEYAALRDGSRAFTAVAAYMGPMSSLLVSIDGNATREVNLEVVTPSFFSLLGVRPALGRFFAEDENRLPNGVPVVVLSYAFWQSQFGGDPGVLGHTVQLDSANYPAFNHGPYTVVGVAPEHFSGVDLDAADVWIPITAAVGEAFGPTPWKAPIGYSTYHVLTRLAPGVVPGQATAVATLAVRSTRRTPERQAAVRATLGSIIATRGPGPAAQEVAITTRLLGVGAIVLLIACANIANLLLARATRRRREIAVRLALGINRRRLVGQLLTEGMLLAFLGGIAGLMLAIWGGLLLRALLLPRITWAGPPVDLRVVGFTAGVTVITGLLASLIPAVQGSRADLTTSLKAGWHMPLGRPSLVRSGLLVVQAALSVVLLVGAGLFLRSLDRAQSIDLGVDADHLVAATLTGSLGAHGVTAPPPDMHARLAAVAERLRAMPGVAGVAEARGSPLMFAGGSNISVPGRDSLPPIRESGNLVSPDYFATVGTPIVRGRAFTPADQAGAQRVAIVNETMAHALWPGEAALGKCIKVGSRSDTLPCTYVVGVARDAHQMKLVEPAYMQLYRPLAQRTRRAPLRQAVLVRASGDPGTLVAPLRRLLANEFPSGVDVWVQLLRDNIDPQFRPWRLGVLMFGAFGVLALVVAGVGLYSVVSYSVVQRTHEMGVRVALGARPDDVARLVLGQSVRVTLVGVAVGCAAAVAAGKLIASLLYDTSVRDPLVFGVVAFVLVAVAIVASLIPARRATRVDPIVALRAE